jgi:hypothetical protein|tara:strand:- start:563 stop:757 length:195 start_codon:yes stop_codon:yes gene_type:complete
MIDGVLQEYDVALGSLDSVHSIDDALYDYLGRGTIESVSGVKSYSKKMMFFYRKKKVEGKKYGW